MRIVHYCIALSALMLVASCDEDAIFEKELYKKRVALISGDSYNVFQENHQLTGGESIGYIAATCGGTRNPDRDILITLEEDPSILEEYNKTMYDADTEKYAKMLSPERYTVEDYTITIKAGERNGKTMIKVRPEGLSPDSLYFVPFRIKDCSAYEVNEEKNSVLYQVSLENHYASQATETTYSMTGLLDGVSTGGSKRMFPVSWNKVRVMAGNEIFQADTEVIDRSAIVLEITSDNRVRITPWKDIVVKAIGGDDEYPNVYKRIEENGHTYNVFSLYYEYEIAGSKHEMKEELRMEVEN